MRWRTVFAAYMILSFQYLVARDGEELVRNSGVQGGIVVHLNCGDGQETAFGVTNGSEPFLTEGPVKTAFGVTNGSEPFLTEGSVKTAFGVTNGSEPFLTEGSVKTAGLRLNDSYVVHGRYRHR